MTADRTGERAAKEARASSVTHQGPTAERYHSMLHRYVETVAGEAPTHPDSMHPFASRTVADVMDPNPLVAHPDAGLKQLATALERVGASSVPVVDAKRRVIGVVTVSDLLARSVSGHSPRPRGHVLDRMRHMRRRRRGRTAADLMSSPPVTTTRTTPIVTAAETAARARVRALPVVDPDGGLVGMVTRSDMMRAFLRPDDEIRHDVERDVVGASRAGRHVTVSVFEGVVHLSGTVPTEAMARRLVHDTHLVPGVLDVQDDLAFEQGDRPLGVPLE